MTTGSSAQSPVPSCQVGSCTERINPLPAEFLLPQREFNGFRWVLVCSDHAVGWWDGSADDEIYDLNYRLVGFRGVT